MGAAISYASQGIGGLIYIGHVVETAIANSVAETTLGTITIPANILRTRCIVYAALKMETNSAQTGTFKLKVGATGAEALIQTVELVQGDATQTTIGGSMLYADTATGDTGALNFTVENKVILTAQNSVQSATKICTCLQLVVVGY